MSLMVCYQEDVVMDKTTVLMPEMGERGALFVDPMDLIRMEVLEHLQNWTTRLLGGEFTMNAWTEFGWHLYKLRERHPEWSFFVEGRWIVEAAHLHDRTQVEAVGRFLARQIQDELKELQQRKAS